jgi:hypothetical protein
LSIHQLEERITPQLNWKKIEEVPEFPLKSFDEVKQRVASNQFGIGLDFTTANQVAQGLYGKGYAVLFTILASVPMIGVLLAIGASIWLGNYWLLAGAPLAFIGQFLSNPYNPAKSFANGLQGVFILILLYALWQNSETATYLPLFFVVAFWVNRSLYRRNQARLIRVALQSERIFIFLYQTGKLGLKDNSTLQMYWHREK